ncbi:MAG: DNA polymerase/3'-5' exonuclease PolX [Nitrospirota bacterium]
MDKKAAANVLEEIGVLLEMKGESVFRCLAYTKAARALRAYPGELDEIIASTDLKGIRGIGEGIRERIIELSTTGRLAYYEELKKSLPPGIIQLLKVPGLGPKKAKALLETLGITSIAELEYACNENRLISLPGFGDRTQKKILENIAFLKKHSERYLYSFAASEAQRLYAPLVKSGKVGRIAVAGSIRRKKEIIKDIDILASSDDPASVMDVFTGLPDVEIIVGKGETKSSVTLASGIAADLRVVTDEQFPYALQYFTGNQDHNVRLRGIAKKMGLKLNEYGLFRTDDDTLVKCADEECIYRVLGLDYVEPELREDMGEVEAALEGGLPNLINEKDILGLFHMHSRYSDGKDEIIEIAEAAKKHGYKYIGITDHSQVVAYAGGMKISDLFKQHEDIDDVNGRVEGFHVFKGSEVDIMPDGTLDYPDEILASLDYTVCSIHSKFKMTEDEATKRILRAMENPHFTILGHPTGRLLLGREGYPLDMKKVIDAAASLGVAIELNAHPQRLDIDWREMRHAREKGVKIAISPDAHNLGGFDDVAYGIGIARKGWLEKKDVLNCMTLEEVEKFFKRRRG